MKIEYFVKYIYMHFFQLKVNSLNHFHSLYIEGFAILWLPCVDNISIIAFISESH